MEAEVFARFPGGNWMDSYVMVCGQDRWTFLASPGGLAGGGA